MSDKPIRFGGHVPFPKKQLGYDDPVEGLPWHRALELAFFKVTSTPEGLEQYGDPNVGATLEQAWRTCGLLEGRTPVCLVSDRQDPGPTKAIDTVMSMNPRDLVHTLGTILRPGDLAKSQVFTYDGVTGHSFLIERFDGAASRFAYHDPWPGSSLLCKQNNAAGVDAQPDGPFDWNVLSTELEKVIVAAFVDRYLWAEHEGQKYYVTYEDLKKSDFWSFFHLTETESRPMRAHDSVHFLRPGGFQSEIQLNVQLNRSGRLRVGRLSMKHSWVGAPLHGLNPYARDIARSFLAAVVAPPDSEGIKDLCEMLNLISNPDYARKLLSDETAEAPLRDAIKAYAGLSPNWSRKLPYSTIDFGGWSEGGVPWLQIRVTNEVT